MSGGDWERLVEDLIKCGLLRSPRVIRAMRLVPRSLFLPESQKQYAAIDMPLLIGHGQTVSAPQGQAPHGRLGETWFR